MQTDKDINWLVNMEHTASKDPFKGLKGKKRLKLTFVGSLQLQINANVALYLLTTGKCLLIRSLAL